jgi:hypothetical protein
VAEQNTECIVDFSLQQWFRDRATVVRYTAHCLFSHRLFFYYKERRYFMNVVEANFTF